MSRKVKTPAPDTPLAPISSDILDRFVRAEPLTPEELNTVVRRFKIAVIERGLGAELTHHLIESSGFVARAQRRQRQNTS